MCSNIAADEVLHHRSLHRTIRLSRGYDPVLHHRGPYKGGRATGLRGPRVRRHAPRTSPSLEPT